MKNPAIVLGGLPLPPSSNNCYATKIQGRKAIRFPTQELKEYQRAVQDWRKENLKLAQLARSLLVARLPEAQAPLRVDRYFCFRRDRLWTLAGQPHKMDASNRVKVLDDCLAEHVLGIDDRWFWSGLAEKVACAPGQAEQVVVVITALEPATFDDLMHVPSWDDPAIVRRARANLGAPDGPPAEPVLPLGHGSAPLP